MTDAPGLRDALALVKNGIPYDKAMKLSPARRLAFCIIFGELDGGKWNWDRMGWDDPK